MLYTKKGDNDYTKRGDSPRPTPKPRPLRAESPMVGRKTSKMEKVAAAESAKITISSKLRDFFGMTILTTAMTRPITKYLMMRLISSTKSKPMVLYILLQQKKMAKYINNKIT